MSVESGQILLSEEEGWILFFKNIKKYFLEFFLILQFLSRFSRVWSKED